LWEKKRHTYVIWVLQTVFALYAWVKLGYKTKIHKLQKAQGRLIVCNHQSVYDGYLINMAFNRPVYIMAGDYLFNRGKKSDRMNYFFAPIPKVKAGADPASMLTTMRVLREGSVVGIFPEASRTYDGRFGKIPESMGRFIKALKVPVTIFNLRGGYGADPRWCRTQRRGRFVGLVKRTLEPEQIAKMSEEQIVQTLETELHTDETSTRYRYRSRVRAEYLERLLYMCPKCAAASTLYSKGKYVMCRACGLRAEYTEQLRFCFENFDTDIQNVADWVAWQDAQLSRYDNAQGVIFYDEHVALQTCDRNKLRCNLGVGRLEIDRTQLRLVTQTDCYAFDFDDITLISPIGATSILFSTRQGSFMLNGPTRFNPYKYVKLCYHMTGNTEQVR
jgi:1-acyl-sn-glycerol-3-phosphate acyltransferase